MLSDHERDGLGSALRLELRQQPSGDLMQHPASEVRRQILERCPVALRSSQPQRGQVFLDETSFSFGVASARLVAEGGGVQFFEPRAKASFSNLSVRCFEASAVFSVLALDARPPGFAALVETRHGLPSRLRNVKNLRSSAASKVQCPLGPNG